MNKCIHCEEYNWVSRKWISVKDRLPRLDNPVLFSDNETVMYGYLMRTDIGYQWCEFGSNTVEAVGIDYWIPLPEPANTNEDTGDNKLYSKKVTFDEIKKRIDNE